MTEPNTIYIPAAAHPDVSLYAVAIVTEPHTYAVCAPYAEVRKAPKAGDKVHVRRTRHRDGKYEDTMRTVEMGRKGHRLVCHGPVPKGYRDRVVGYPSARRTETVEIMGLVVGTYEEVNP